MKLQYFFKLTLLATVIAICSSCLKSEQRDVTLSSDAQVYYFSLSSEQDHARILKSTKFTIDQIGEKIFNQDSLPYLFHVDSVHLDISGSPDNTLSSFIVHLKNNDSVYDWNGRDSIAINRLTAITSKASNKENAITYQFKLNVHQQDPEILTWEKRVDNHLAAPIDEQKTILLDNRLITYYKSGDAIRAVQTSVDDGRVWDAVNISGLPTTIQLKSMVSTVCKHARLYVLDDKDQVYESADGKVWRALTISYPVRAIYGNLPLFDGSAEVLLVVEDAGVLKLATTTDFCTIHIEETVLPNDFPVADFTSVTVNSPSVFVAKYIILAGGVSNTGKSLQDIWLIQKKEGKTEVASQPSSVSLNGCSLFFYNNKLYLLNAGKSANTLYISNDYGLHWQPVGDNQALPKTFDFRKNASTITDANHFIWIVGGSSQSNAEMAEVWRGRLNKFAKK